jgi:hypothetical protein
LFRHRREQYRPTELLSGLWHARKVRPQVAQGRPVFGYKVLLALAHRVEQNRLPASDGRR